MRIQYRQEIAENQYREVEFEGNLAELAEITQSAKEMSALWKSMFGDDGSFWDTLKGLVNL